LPKGKRVSYQDKINQAVKSRGGRMLVMPGISELMLLSIFVFIVDVSFNLRRVNKNISKLIKKYEDVHGQINK